MLSIGLKNGILFMLIVLILHFLVKNAIHDRSTDVTGNDINTDLHMENVSPVDKAEERKQELYDFVMNESFSQPAQSPQPNEEKLDDTFPVECDITQPMLPPKDPVVQYRQNKSRKSADSSAFFVVGEYEQDKNNNGGNLGGLSGYDEYQEQFELYAR